MSYNDTYTGMTGLSGISGIGFSQSIPIPMDRLLNLSIWLTADPVYCYQDAGATVPCSIGDLVYTWLDRSGNNYHFVQATSGKRPRLQQASGKYYVDFDGVDDWMDATVPSGLLNDDFTMAMAYRFSGSGDRMPLSFGQNGPTGYRRYMWITTDNRLSFNGENSDLQGAIKTSGTDYRWVNTRNSGLITIRTNNSVDSSGSPSLNNHTGTVARIGANLAGGELAPGRHYGIVVCNANQSSDNITLLDTYLASLLP